MKISSGQIFPFTQPLTTTFEIAGYPITERSGLYLKLATEDGRVGWGEIAPLPGVHRESFAEASAVLRQWLQQLPRPFIGNEKNLNFHRSGFGIFDQLHELPPSVSWGIEQALWGILNPQVMKVPHDPHGESNRPGVAGLLQIHLTKDPKVIEPVVASVQKSGGHTLKVKIGRQSWEQDAADLVALVKFLPPSFTLRLDGNRRLTRQDYERFEEAIKGLPIEYVEEPLDDPGEYHAEGRPFRLPLAIDEGLWDQTPQTLRPFSWYVLKPTRLGGISQIFQWHQTVGEHIVLSSTFDTSLTLKTLMAVAQYLNLKTDQGLGTERYLKTDSRSWSEFLGEPHLDLNALFRGRDHQPFFKGANGTVTYAQMRNGVRQRELEIARLGMEKSQRLGILGLNPVDTMQWHLAALIAGVVIVPLNPRTPVHTLQQWCTQFAIDVLLVSDEVYEDFSVTWVPDNNPSTRLVRWSNDSSQHSPIIDSDYPVTDFPLVSAQQEACITLTSGSSNHPKGVRLNVEQCKSSALGTNQFYGVTAEDRWLVSLPLFHVGGLMIVWRTMLAGGCALVVHDPADLADDLIQYLPTLCSMVPTQLHRLMVHADALAVLQKCKAILLGGAPCPQALWEAFKAAKLPVSLTYGMTESASQLTATPPGTSVLDPQVVGFPLAGREVKIQDGIIMMRGLVRFQGYCDGVKLDPPFDSEGWFATQDLGSWESDGSLRVIGRRDDVFISGGENISPIVIEQKFQEHDLHHLYFAVAAPHQDMGTVPALVIWGADMPDVLRLQDLTRDHLSGIQRPRHIFWYEVPASIEYKPSRTKARTLVQEYFSGRAPAHLMIWQGGFRGA